eukprot:m.178167 g.178167  ORF g.178167 m.178167 type:complete len:704 (-) comp14922_c0_seq4:5436-7547(-)
MTSSMHPPVVQLRLHIPSDGAAGVEWMRKEGADHPDFSAPSRTSAFHGETLLAYLVVSPLSWQRQDPSGVWVNLPSPYHVLLDRLHHAFVDAQGDAAHDLPAQGDEPPLSVDFNRMVIKKTGAGAEYPLRCATTRDERRGGSIVPHAATGAAAVAAEIAQEGSARTASGTVNESMLSRFETRFTELTLTTSVTVPDTKPSKADVQMQKESSRFHPCAVQSLPYSDLWNTPFGRERAIITAEGDVVHAVQVQLSNVSPMAKQVTITVVANLFTDPVVESKGWADQINYLCSTTPGSGPVSAQSSSKTSDAQHFFSARVSATLDLHRPPHVFCSTSNVGSTRFISVEVHNHTQFPVTLDHLEVFLSPLEHSSASGTSGAAPAATSSSEASENSPGSMWRRSVSVKKLGASLSPYTSPASSRRGSLATTTTPSASPGGRRRSSAPTKVDLPETPVVSGSPQVSTSACVTPLSVVLPQNIDPDARYSYAFAIEPPPLPKQGDGEIEHDASKVYVMMTWSTSMLLTPIACQYELFSVQPRAVKLTVSISHRRDSVRVGKRFDVLYTLSNMSDTMYHNLFLNIAPPALAEHQAPVKSLPETVSFAEHTRNFSQRRQSLVHQSIQSIDALPEQARLHACVLDTDAVENCGLVCMEERVHIGACSPNSQTSIAVPFLAFSSGLYEVGLVQITEYDRSIAAYIAGQRILVPE